jgi:hypothetical protein
VPRQRAALYDPTIISLPIDQLVHCLAGVAKSELMPCLADSGTVAANTLPLVIRERDVRYQCRRAVLYRRLLQGYPFRSALVFFIIPNYFKLSEMGFFS